MSVRIARVRVAWRGVGARWWHDDGDGWLQLQLAAHVVTLSWQVKTHR